MGGLTALAVFCLLLGLTENSQKFPSDFLALLRKSNDYLQTEELHSMAYEQKPLENRETS